MTRGHTGHNCGGSKRTLDEAEIRAAIVDWESRPPSSERAAKISTLRRQLRNIGNRSNRNG